MGLRTLCHEVFFVRVQMESLRMHGLPVRHANSLVTNRRRRVGYQDALTYL